MAKMFHNCPEESGRSINAHPEQEYEHPPSQVRPVPPRWGLRPDGTWGDIPSPPPALTERTRERVLESTSRAYGRMTFEGDLQPRNEPEARDEGQLK